MKLAAERRAELRMLPQIFAAFLKIGPSTFGGGYAMIATIEKEIVERREWMHRDEMRDMVSVAGSAPGGVAVNSAAFVGYRLGGLAGAAIAVIGITLPTLAIVLLLSLTFSFFRDQPKVEAALKGVHAAVTALIMLAAWKMARTSLFDAVSFGIAAVSLGLLLLTDIHSLWLIAAGPILGFTVSGIRRMRGMEPRTEPEHKSQNEQAMLPEYYI
ncbi:chromate transporter [Saccharibacillus kuerlensis]|uniref:Chromate transporter n=1 Tax=Saccharibacillus kuerlensis TaxID=459527 RepID=A0ABQ2L0M1_9BACL|nr:chromate transporter [Saccharibacillus kuerlensis]GGN96983.1 chromate transporter [Saccharibacillus kuerlensis]